MDQQRIQALFESHHRAVYGFVLRSCADPAVAEDLTQDVFLRALRDERAEPAAASERPWLFRIARNLLIDRWRHSERQPQRVSASEDNLAAATAGSDLRTDLRRALATLPEVEREAFLLREVAGLSYNEIGEITNASAAAGVAVVLLVGMLWLARSPETVEAEALPEPDRVIRLERGRDWIG